MALDMKQQFEDGNNKMVDHVVANVTKRIMPKHVE